MHTDLTKEEDRNNYFLLDGLLFGDFGIKNKVGEISLNPFKGFKRV